ncbi:unnamed protein product, partial [Rotaria magnacalcarata]
LTEINVSPCFLSYVSLIQCAVMNSDLTYSKLSNWFASLIIYHIVIQQRPLFLIYICQLATAMVTMVKRVDLLYYLFFDIGFNKLFYALSRYKTIVHDEVNVEQSTIESLQYFAQNRLPEYIKSDQTGCFLQISIAILFKLFYKSSLVNLTFL